MGATTTTTTTPTTTTTTTTTTIATRSVPLFGKAALVFVSTMIFWVLVHLLALCVVLMHHRIVLCSVRQLSLLCAHSDFVGTRALSCTLLLIHQRTTRNRKLSTSLVVFHLHIYRNLTPPPSHPHPLLPPTSRQYLFGDNSAFKQASCLLLQVYYRYSLALHLLLGCRSPPGPLRGQLGVKTNLTN